MAQELNFIAAGANYTCAPTKLDKSKLYGTIERVIVDDNNNVCEAVSMDESGTIIPKGGISQGIVDQNLNWVERSELQAVNSKGEQIEQIPSTFTTPVNLDKKVTVEHFLDHSITTIYQLAGDYLNLIEFIGSDIYEFSFNYRNSYETSPAFLITNGAELFMLVGFKNEFEFVTFEDTAVIDTGAGDFDDDDFEIDFSVM